MPRRKTHRTGRPPTLAMLSEPGFFTISTRRKPEE
jgi:hypothetical protein